MSMHEFEDLVERSIQLLASTERPLEALRSSYATLYEFQSEWDTGYTHFRVIDLLLAAHFVYRIPVAEYPGQPQGASVEDGWVTLAGHNEPTYCEGQQLFIDAGSEAWSALVAADRLTGLDATAPKQLDLFELALDVCQLAEQAKNPLLIGMWYRLLVAHALMNGLEGVEEISAVSALRALVKRTGALELDLEYGCMRTPGAEDRAETPLLDWWFTL